jgi:glutamine amidotransferase
LFAHCSTSLFYIVRQWPFSTARLIDADMEVDFSQTNHAGDRVSVIATQPLTDNEEWMRFGEGRTDHVRRRAAGLADIRIPIPDEIRQRNAANLAVT